VPHAVQRGCCVSAVSAGARNESAVSRGPLRKVVGVSRAQRGFSSFISTPPFRGLSSSSPGCIPDSPLSPRTLLLSLPLRRLGRVTKPVLVFNRTLAMSGRGCFKCGGFGHQAAQCTKSAPVCYNCGGEGHLSKDCTSEPKPKTCFKCNEVGHLSRDCPNATATNSSGFSSSGTGQECYRCGQTGHIARACPEATNTRSGNYSSFSGNTQKTCYTCGGAGHLSRDCVQGPKCYNCNGVGHLSKDCSQPQRRACYTCGAEGHVAKDCPSTTDTAAA